MTRTGTFNTFAAAVDYANTFVADSNAADFAGTPVTSYTIAEVDRPIYGGTEFVVAFVDA